MSTLSPLEKLLDKKSKAQAKNLVRFQKSKEQWEKRQQQLKAKQFKTLFKVLFPKFLKLTKVKFSGLEASFLFKGIRCFIKTRQEIDQHVDEGTWEYTYWRISSLDVSVNEILLCDCATGDFLTSSDGTFISPPKKNDYTSIILDALALMDKMR